MPNWHINVAADRKLTIWSILDRRQQYVACTRARDRLLVSSVSPASEFMDDLAKG